MNRNQDLVRGIACTLAFVWACGAGLAQERTRDPEQKKESLQKSRPGQERPEGTQKGPHDSKINQLWREISQLHKQIVGLEVADPSLRETPDEPATPSSDKPERPSQRKVERQPGDAQKPDAPQKTRPGQEQPPESRGSQNEAKITELWILLGMKQRELLKMEVASAKSRPRPSTTPSTNDRPKEQPEASNPRSTEARAGDTPEGQSQKKTRPEQARPRDLREGPHDAMINRLWQEIAQLHRQIVALEVAEAAGSRKPTGPDSSSAEEGPKSERKPIEP